MCYMCVCDVIVDLIVCVCVWCIQRHKEYIETRKLHRLCVCVSGSPASGQTYFSRKISEYYGIPYVSVAQVIRDVLAQVLMVLHIII